MILLAMLYLIFAGISAFITGVTLLDSNAIWIAFALCTACMSFSFLFECQLIVEKISRRKEREYSNGI